MTTEVLLTGKGQFTLNKGLLAHLQVCPGERVILKKLPDNSIKIESTNKQKDFMRLAGFIKSEVVLNDEELKEAINNSHCEAGNAGLRISFL